MELEKVVSKGSLTMFKYPQEIKAAIKEVKDNKGGLVPFKLDPQSV